MASIFITNIAVLYTMDTVAGDPLGRVNHAAILIADGVIQWVGREGDAPELAPNCVHHNANGAFVLPGLIDCHTHLIFAGSRRSDFVARANGVSYVDILKNGGGIIQTTRAVRQASANDLAEDALKHVRAMFARGVTTVEAKTGYGLSLESELKMLEAMQILRQTQVVDISCTFLGAHAVPPEYANDRLGYVEHIIHGILPVVAKQKIATACDVFIENGAFSVEDGRQILTAAKQLGLKLHIHGEQLSQTGATQLGAELRVNNVSHLEYITEQDIRALKASGTVAVVLPIAQEYLGMKQLAPARALADAGVPVAIATDFNPGSAMCDDLHLSMRLAVTRCGLTCDEALLGVTKYAAQALGLKDRGMLKVGMRADLCLLSSSPYDLLYNWCENPVVWVLNGSAQSRSTFHPLN